jgi:predicted PurR-regulated permease PerM
LSAFLVFRNTLIVAGTLILIYLLSLSLNILVVLLIAIIIASALRPAVMRLTRWHVPQGLAIPLVYGFISITAILLVIVVLPPVIDQLGSYMLNDDRLAGRLIYAQRWFQTFINQNMGMEIAEVEPEVIREAVADFVEQITVTAPTLIDEVSQLFSEFVLVFVMGIYWLTSRDRAVDFVIRYFPPHRRASIEAVLEEIEGGLGAYVRGLVLVSLIVGILNFTALTILRVPNAATLAFLTGLTTAIPIVGGFLGVLVATTLALLSSPLHALFVLVTTVLVQQIENYVLTPRIMSRSVAFDAILVLVFVAAGFALNGVIGALLAIPLAATVFILFKHVVLEPRKAEVTPEVVEGGILLKSKDS